MGWTADSPGFAGLGNPARATLDALPAHDFAPDTVLFRPGEAARGFVVVLAGRVEVHLVGPTGREILLYAVAPGQSCVQSTLSLLGGEDYTGEAMCVQPTRAVLIPRDTFLHLMDGDAAFRAFVFGAFARRMQAMMHLLEQVAFTRVEARLAAALLDMADTDGVVHATHAELATRIGSAREVVSRRLDALVRRRAVTVARGTVSLCDPAAIRALAQAAG